MEAKNGGKEWREKMTAKKIAGENGGKERRERKWRIKEIKYKNTTNKISTNNLTETKIICHKNK
jgi:hypothetical protein